MRHPVLLAVLVATAACAACAWAEDKTGATPKELMYLVKLEDHAGVASHQVMTTNEWASLQQTIAREAKAFDRAVANAQKKWKAGEDTKKKSFPAGAIKQQKATKVDTFDSPDKANDRLARIQKSEGDKLKRDAERKAEQDKTAKKSKTQMAKEQDREREREATEAEARQLVENELQELLAAMDAAKGANPAPK
jgi:hypothetical protein